MEGYFLTMYINDKNEETKNKIVELRFVKYSQMATDLVVLHGINFLLVSQMRTMNSYKGKYQIDHKLAHNNWFVLNLPTIYQNHECYIKNVVVDEKTLNIAIACNKGYLIYNWINQKWLNSTMNKHPNETYVNNNCLSWWKGVLMFSALTHNAMNKSTLICHIINSKVNDTVQTLKDFDYINLYHRIDNNKLIIFDFDFKLHILTLELVKSKELNSYEYQSSPKVSIVNEIVISLENIVPHPLTFIEVCFCTSNLIRYF